MCFLEDVDSHLYALSNFLGMKRTLVGTMYSLFNKSKHKFSYESGKVIISRDVTDEEGIYPNTGFVARLRNGHPDKTLEVFQMGHSKVFASIYPGDTIMVKSIAGTWSIVVAQRKEHKLPVSQPTYHRSKKRCDSSSDSSSDSNNQQTRGKRGKRGKRGYDGRDGKDCPPHKCCPERGPQGPEGPQGPPGPTIQLNIEEIRRNAKGDKGDKGDPGENAVVTDKQLANIIASLSHLCKEGPPGFSCCPEKSVVEGSCSSPGITTIAISGGTAVLFTASLVGGGGGGSAATSSNQQEQLFGGNGGGSGYLTTGQFILSTPVTLKLFVGAGGDGGKEVDDTGTDGECTYIQDATGTKYLYAYGGTAPTLACGGAGYFGGGGLVSAGVGVVKNGKYKTDQGNSGHGGGYNAGLSDVRNILSGCGGGSSPLYGKGGNGGTEATVSGQNGTIGGGGGGGLGGMINNMATPLGGKGGDGLITYSYRVF